MYLILNVKIFRCIDIFTPEEQKILIKYRKENFAEKELVYRERRLIGKCPLTPEEVKLYQYFILMFILITVNVYDLLLFIVIMHWLCSAVHFAFSYLPYSLASS